jgi:hypothetical protein
LNKAEDAVCLGFRLEKPRAKAVIKQHDWIRVNSFGSLGKNGWVETDVRTKAQCKVIVALLRESHSLHAIAEDVKPTQRRAKNASGRRRGKPGSEAADDPVTRRLEAVLRQKREEGWKPMTADAFDE